MVFDQIFRFAYVRTRIGRVNFVNSIRTEIISLCRLRLLVERGYKREGGLQYGNCYRSARRVMGADSRDVKVRSVRSNFQRFKRTRGNSRG